MKRTAIVLLCFYALILGGIGSYFTVEKAAALDNGVRVTNTYTGVLTTHPVWHGRWFAREEIANYPRPYATPSSTGTRAAVATWQATVLNRWRDATAVRVITSARAGSPSWSTAGTTLTSIVVTAGIATVTFPSAHNLAVGDRLQVAGAPQVMNTGLDNIIVYEVTSGTVVKYINRAFVSASYVTSGSYSSGVTVYQKIDPVEAPTTCRYYSANHGFYRGETVTMASVGGITPSSATQLITGVTRNEFVTNATCSGTYTSGGTATGPDNGSVQFALVAYKTTIPASGSTYVDFVNSTDPCSSGNQAACDAAGFDETEMLAETWNFDLDATAAVKSGSTATLRSSARTMLTAGDLTAASYCGPRIWARGPVMTKVIVEFACDGALTYDFGWKIRPGTTFTAAIAAGDTEIPVASVANISVNTVAYAWTTNSTSETMTVTAVTCAVLPAPCITVTRALTGTAAAYASGRTLGNMQWEDATDPYKSLHPRFDLTFVNGWSGVKGSAIVSNEYIWKIQNLWYSIDLKTGSTPTSRIAKTTFKHTNSTSWKLDAWDGADPEFFCATAGTLEACTGGTRTRRYLIDYNTPYLSYSKVLPEYQLKAGKTAALNTIAGNFANGDMGAIAPPILGGGTFGADVSQPGSGGSDPEKGTGQQEAWILNDIQAMLLQGYSAAGYQMTFGTTVPGGAGNAESQRHVPWGYREDAGPEPRYIMPGFATAADLAFGRPLSVYARPTWMALTVSSFSGVTSNFDRRRLACSDAAPAIPPITNDAATLSTGARGYPCWFLNSVGSDGWPESSAYTHQNEWNELAYLLTADPRYLDSIQQTAAWNSGQEANDPYTPGEPGGRAIGHSWAQPSASTTAVRGQGGWTRAALAVAMFTPNVPQFGYTAPSVETYYWNEKLWDMGLAQEGLYGTTTGYFSQMYPHATLTVGTETFELMPTTCPVTGLLVRNPSIWSYVRCQVAVGHDNPLGIMGIAAAATCPSGQHIWIDCAAGTYSEMGQWYYHLTSVTWGKAESLGLPMFNYSRRVFANYSFSVFGSTNWNPWLNDMYQIPIRLGRWVLSLTEMYAGLKTSWTDAGQFRTKAGLAFNTGAAAPTNISYITQWWADLATMKDLSPVVTGNLDGCVGSACSWTNAWDFIQTNVPHTTDDEIVKFYLLPRAEFTVLCVPGTSTAVCSYTAPTTDACTYRIGTTAPTDTLDATDVSDGGGAVARVINLSSLPLATAHYLRVTCGQRVVNFATGDATGTGRTFAEFTTDSPRSGVSGRVGIGGKARIGQ